LSAWIARGAEAASGVETTYHDLTPGEADDSVATMIFNAWFRAYNAGVFGDEGIERVWQPDPRGTHIRAIHKVSFSRGPGNPLTISSWSPETQESVFFDDVGTPEVESSWEIALKALAEALAALRAPASAPGEGGFGTDDMDAWRWGLRHMLVLDSLLEQFAGSNPMISLFTRRLSITPEHVPIAEDLPPGDPRHGLPGFPRPGDFFSIDVANPPFEGDSWAYSYGPVMRMVIALQDGRVEGRIIIPGGQSDSASSPHFADQVGPWLGNRTEPMRFHVADVVASATGHEIMRPR